MNLCITIIESQTVSIRDIGTVHIQKRMKIKLLSYYNVKSCVFIYTFYTFGKIKYIHLI